MGQGAGGHLSRIAIVTDSASDLPLDVAANKGITIVPLVVSFGSESFKAGTELSTADFWRRMTAPDAPMPTTAASSPGDFRVAFEQAFATGAEAVISINVAGTLSGTLKAVQIARDLLPDREIHVVDSGTASMGVGMLALMASEMSEAGSTAAAIARAVEDRSRDVDLYVALDTLEYLKRGGRISGAQAAIG